MPHKKAPGEDSITSTIHLREVLKLFPLVTALYNGRSPTENFSKIWKRAKLVPIVHPGKENSFKISKFMPISLLNVGGKVFEKVRINRIMHHIYINNQLNQNQ